MLINCQFDVAKAAPNTKRYKFACKKLQIIKSHCLNYAFQKIARYTQYENF